jgi:hypothetical protein
MDFLKRIFSPADNERAVETMTITAPCDCAECGQYNQQVRQAVNHGDTRAEHAARIRWNAHCIKAHGGRA